MAQNGQASWLGFFLPESLPIRNFRKNSNSGVFRFVGHTVAGAAAAFDRFSFYPAEGAGTRLRILFFFFSYSIIAFPRFQEGERRAIFPALPFLKNFRIFPKVLPRRFEFVSILRRQNLLY